MAALDIPSHEIIVIDPSKGTPENWEALREQCFSIRIEVFHREQGFPVETELDDLEDVAIHFLLRLTSGADAGTPVGTIRTTRHTNSPIGEPYYKLSRFVVVKEYRNYHFGVKLVNAMHDYVRADVTRSKNTPNGASGETSPAAGDHNAFARVVCHSQIYIKGFYAKLGYVPEGDEFPEDGAPHQKMVLRLPLSS